ncbi:hypothetical protein FEDK69T_18680 [Flavobacterium enshiense DK69]|nr:hypothetical protein FEDK69T_18680 [Flavobacterium enshiense DK69]
MGIHSFTILIYDNTCDLYRRVILKTDGDTYLINKSIHTLELLKYFEGNMKSTW